MTTSAPETATGRVRRIGNWFRAKPRRIAYAVVALFVLWVIWSLASAGLSAKQSLDAADEAKTTLLAGDADAARNAVAEATAAAKDARAELHEAPLSWIGHIPGVGRPIVSAQAGAEVLDRTMSEVVTPIAASDLVYALRPDSPGAASFDIEAIKRGLPALGPASKAAAAIAARAAQIPDTGFLPPMDSALANARDQSRQLSTGLSLANDLGPALPALLGEGKALRYLMVFQTNSEARGTGGLMGGTAILTVADGTIMIDQAASNFGLRLTDVAPIDLGPEFETNYGRWDASSNWQNANFSAHFPYAAEIWKSIWAQHGGGQVDGVIATDPVALSYLLEATGPVVLPSGEVITAENVTTITLNESYFRYREENQQEARKEYLTTISRTVIGAVTGPDAAKGAVVKAVMRALEDNRLMMWSADPAAEEKLAQTALGHTVPDDDAPYAAVVLNNGAGGKLDYYLDRGISYIAGDCSGPTRDSVVTIALKNNAPEDPNLPSYLLGRRTEATQYAGPPGTNRTVVTVYATKGAELKSFTINGSPAFQLMSSERGHPMYVAVVLLKPGEAKTLEFRLTEPAAAGAARVPVQPLVRPAALQVAVPECR